MLLAALAFVAAACRIESVDSLAVQPRGAYQNFMSLPSLCPVFDARSAALTSGERPLVEDENDRAFKKSFTTSAHGEAAKFVSGVGVGVSVCI